MSNRKKVVDNLITKDPQKRQADGFNIENVIKKQIMLNQAERIDDGYGLSIYKQDQEQTPIVYAD